MKKEMTAMVLASAMAAPFAMVGDSLAAGENQRRTVRTAGDSGTSTKIEYEAEMRFRAADVKAEAEVEWEQGTRNGVLRTKFGGEVEIVLVNPLTPPVATNVDAVIKLGATTCTFLNDPRVIGPIVVGAATVYKVEFNGSLLQSGANPIVPRGLDCGGIIPAVAAGDIVTVDITGLPAGTTALPTLTGTFALDD